jgi:hypothetical protein
VKQPLMTIPPAQAEALYDAALEHNEPGKSFRLPIGGTPAGDWDDGASMDAGGDEASREARRFRSIPLRASFRAG